MTSRVQRAPGAAEQPQPRPDRLDHRAVETPYERSRNRTRAESTARDASPSRGIPGYEATVDLTALLARSQDRLGVTAELTSLVTRVWRTHGLTHAARVHVIAVSAAGTATCTVDNPADLSPDGVRNALSFGDAAAPDEAALTVVDLTGSRLEVCPATGEPDSWTITVGSAPLRPHVMTGDGGQPVLAHRNLSRIQVSSPTSIPPDMRRDEMATVERLVELLEEER